jgi:hypothetical protein
VISNAEAYDNWPSDEERPFVRATQVPVLGDVMLWTWSRRPMFRLALKEAKAVYDPKVLSAELLDGYIRANLSDRHRRAKTRRFLAGQFDPENNRVTMDLLDGLRRFDHPTLLVWAKDDPHFESEWGERLLGDIPGAVRLELLPETGHLLMEERPERFAALVGIPPLAGFVGKFLLFGAAIEAGFTWLAVVAILNSVLSLAVYLRIVVPMYQTPKEAPTSTRAIAAVWALALVATVAVGIAAQALLGEVS